MKKILIIIFTFISVLFFSVFHFNHYVFSYVATRGQFTNEKLNYKNNDYLDCIIILDDSSLIDLVKTNDGIYSQEEINLVNQKINIQKQYQEYLLNQFSINLDNSYSYSYLFNGFSAKIKYAELDKIYNLDFIDDILISNIYEKQDFDYTLLAESTEIIYSDNLMNSNEMNKNGYTGKNTAVAVLDTGMDVTHIAFTGEIADPKYSKEDIENIINTTTLNTIGVNNVTQVYYSEKIPFGYDYADSDANVFCSSLIHGAHVAGIIGANNGATRGVATDCQIIPMKVFKDDGYSSSSGILAAVEDACKLGVDVINMSLGAVSGNTYTDEKTQSIYDNVREYGINLIVASGNDTYMGYNNVNDTDLPLATTPDYGVTGSPASYPCSTAVASFNNPYYFSDCIYCEDLALPYATPSSGADIRASLDGKTIEFVEVPNLGSKADYQDIDVSGKIALVKRGEISFAEKHLAAFEAGAVAMIAYDPNEDVFVGMQIEEQKIPCAFITKSFYELIKEKKYTSFTFKKDGYAAINDLLTGRKLSDFSSFGCAGDLVIKPDVSGPGGNIYAPLINNEYGQLSGTSMACPNIAGLVAITRQYIDEKFKNLTLVEKVDLAIGLIMSTADIQYDENLNPYLVRSQGAGLANAKNILNANTYLSVDSSNKPKAEMGESEDGIFSFEFKINNLTDSKITYDLNDLTLTEDYKTVDNVNYALARSKILNKDDYELTFSDNVIDNQVTVNANESVKISVNIKLSTEYKNAQDLIFKEGSFIEGYIILSNESETLSLPYLGFYGSWQKLHIFEPSIYVEDTIINMQPSLAVAFDSAGTGYELGLNLANGKYYEDKIYFTTSTLKNFAISSYSGLCRNVDEIKFKIFDEDNNLVYENICVNYKKSSYSYSNDYTIAAYDYDLGWDGTKKDGTKAVNNEKFTYITTAYRKDRKGNILYEESWSFDFAIDNLSPSVTSSRIYQEEDKMYLEVIAKDNINISYISLYDYSLNNDLCEPFINENSEKETVALFDITNIYEQLIEANARLGEIKVGVFDWAYNFIYETITIGPSVIAVDKEYKIGVGGQKNLNLQISPSNITIDDLIFESSNEKVATVEKGIVKGISKGEATISIKGLNGYCVETKIIVDGVADEKIEINKDDFSMRVNDSVGLKVIFTPTHVTDNTITWSSSDENIATVTQNGVVFAISEGIVEIKAISANGNTDTIKIEVLPPMVTSIKIYLFSKTVKVGYTIKFDSFAVTPDNVDTKTLIYTSSDENIATIDNLGNIKGISEGTATLRVSSADENIYDEVTVKVININPSNINIASSYSLYLEEELQLVPEILPVDTTFKNCTYSSNNPKIVEIDEFGTVKANSVGVATITICCGSLTKDVSVTVLPIEATSISTLDNFIVMNMGEAKTIEYNISPQNVTYPNIIWYTSNSDVCTVYNGVLKALSDGYATISAQLSNGLKFDIYVLVNKVSNLDLVSDLFIDENEQIYLNSDYTYTLKSENSNILLTNNLVKGLKKGTAEILVKNQIGEEKIIYINVEQYKNNNLLTIFIIFSLISVFGLITFEILYLKKK